MTDLYDWQAPDGVQLLIEHLKPMVAPGAVRSEKPNGSLLPFIRVMRAGGPDDGLTDKGKYGVFVFDADEIATKNLARRVMRRIQLLAPRFGGQVPVTVSSGTFYFDNVKVLEPPRPMPYIDDSIPRSMYMYSGIYEAWLRIAAAT